MPRLLLSDLPIHIIFHPAQLRFRDDLISLLLSLSRFAVLISRITLAASLVSLLEYFGQSIRSLLSLRVGSPILLLPYGRGRHGTILIHRDEDSTIGFDLLLFLEH